MGVDLRMGEPGLGDMGGAGTGAFSASGEVLEGGREVRRGDLGDLGDLGTPPPPSPAVSLGMRTARRPSGAASFMACLPFSRK